MANRNKKKEKPNSLHKNRKLYLLLICIISLIAFSSNFNGDILNFDDNEYFEDYPDIVNLSWQNVGNYFSNHYVLMYHPLPILSFAVQYNLFKLNPVPYHLFNFLFHLINILLVYLLTKRLSKGSIMVGLLVALIFAVHPMNTEAVSWISARSSVMYSCFFLASLLAYWQYLHSSAKLKWYIIAFVFALLSFFSKANALPLPIVLILFDWFARRKLKKDVVRAGAETTTFDIIPFVDKVPFFALSIIFGLVALSDAGTNNNLNIGAETFSLGQGLLLSIYSLSNYLVQFFAPFHLSAIHTYPLKVDGALPTIFYVAPLLAAIVVFLLFKFRNNRPVIFGFAFFAIIVSVTLQIVPSRLFIMADRYVYLPYVGFAFILATLINSLATSNNFKQKASGKKLATAMVIWALLLAVVTFNRNKVWNTTENLVTDIIAKNNEHPYLARAYGIRAAIKEGRRDSRGALIDLEKAIELRPNEGETYYNRGQIFFRMSQWEKAKKDFKKAGEILGTHYTLANYLGGCEYNLNNYVSALEYYSEAIELKPDYAEAIRNRGSTYASILEYDKALKDYSAAIKLVPNESDAFKFRGYVYLKLNNREKACEDLLHAKLLGAQGVDESITANNCSN